MTAALRPAPTRWRVSDLVLDTKRQRVWRGSREIPLPKLTYDLFATLVRRSTEVTTDEQLMAEVWPGLVVGPETVSQRVKLLRCALGDDSRMPRYVGRLRARGYHLVPTAEPLHDEEPGASAAASPSAPAVDPIDHEVQLLVDGFADRPGIELTLLEPAAEAEHVREPDWASTHVLPNQMFADMLESQPVEAEELARSGEFTKSRLDADSAGVPVAGSPRTQKRP